MRITILPAVTGAVLLMALPAQALTSAAPVAAGQNGVVLASDGCGPFGHRSHYGYCKDNLHPELTYQPGRPRHDDYGYGPGPRFHGWADADGDGYYPRRCFIRETYDGPVRICR